MIRLALLLLGPQFIRTRWHVLAGVGWVWAILGAALIFDVFYGTFWFPIHVFGYLLILEALVTRRHGHGDLAAEPAAPGSRNHRSFSANQHTPRLWAARGRKAQ